MWESTTWGQHGTVTYKSLNQWHFTFWFHRFTCYLLIWLYLNTYWRQKEAHTQYLYGLNNQQFLKLFALWKFNHKMAAGKGGRYPINRSNVKRKSKESSQTHLTYLIPNINKSLVWMKLRIYYNYLIIFHIIGTKLFYITIFY